jgi:competence protein ComEA
LVELNSATAMELMALPGIGARRAQEIIRFRTLRPFVRAADLMRIRGIGRATYLKLRPLVRVEPPAEPAAAPAAARTPAAATTAAPAAAPAG